MTPTLTLALDAGVKMTTQKKKTEHTHAMCVGTTQKTTKEEHVCDFCGLIDEYHEDQYEVFGELLVRVICSGCGTEKHK
jgi:hypothetical protein